MKKSAIYLCVALFWPQTAVTQLRAEEKSVAVTIELQSRADVSLAGILIAVKDGLFAKQGLAVKLKPAGENSANGDDATALLIRLMNAQDYLVERASGAELVAIAGNYVDSSVAFYFRRDRNIRSEKDLTGKSIGYDGKSDTGLVFEWFLSKNSVLRSSITEIPTNPGVQGLLDNTLDVLVGHAGIDDSILQAKAIDYGTLDPRAFGVHALGTVYVASETRFRTNPEILTRFLRALIAGWDRAYADIDQTALLVAPQNADDRDRVKRSLENQRQFLRPGGARFGEILKSRWQDIYTFMLQRRLIRAPIDLSKATDNKLLTEAYRSRLNSPTTLN